MNLEQLMKVQFSTASKHPENASETPASVTVITRSDIRAYGWRTLAEVLQSVRGYWVNSDRDYSYLGVRGFARPGDNNTRILLLVNGHRLNDNIFYQALIGTEFPLDVDLIERIEIVRGPASSLYGTNAFFGVINVVTQQPPISPTLETSVETGSEWMRKARVTVGLPRVLDGILFSASLYRFNGEERVFFSDLDPATTNGGIAQDVDGDRSESAYALARWKHWRMEALAGSREKLMPTGAYGAIFNDPWNRSIDSRGYGELSYQREFVSGLQLNSRWFYDGYGFRGSDAFLLDGSRRLAYAAARGDAVGTELNISVPVAHRNRITTGFEARYNLRKDQYTRLEGQPGYLLDDHRTDAVEAFYAQDEVKLTSRLSLNGGVRLDHYRDFEASVSPRVAAIFKPDAKTTLKYMFGHAFRVPNAYEMYYSDPVSQIANPALRPETIDSHNVSLERALTPNLRAVAEVFYNQLDKLIDGRMDSASGLTQYVNVNSVTGKGIEAEIEARRGGWRGLLSYTFQDSRSAQTRAALVNLPRHVAKLHLEAPLWSRLLTGAEVLYESSQTTYVGSRVGELVKANVTVSTRKPIFGLDLSASAYNLLDRRNYDPGNLSLPEERVPEYGREFRIKLTRTFSSH